ncbi:hypothetical protein E2C01_053580 [Portunus trituberculatus]|uniref:Uncharacterized protein n=1 Tax=Portunus trituberculatus TaxID=210409 RepID=A0A5B7GPT7_PORTR|nr:hypothetical protein [Portunus trituberculatus]
MFVISRLSRKKRVRGAKPSLTPLSSDTEVLENNDDKNEDVPSIYLQNCGVTEINEGNGTEEKNGQAEASSAADVAEDVGEGRQKEQDVELKEEELARKVIMTWAEEVDEAD